MVDLGTDISSDWTFNESGDLNLVTGGDNIAQALINRLTCDLGSLDLYYSNYGSLLREFFSWKSWQNPLDFIRIEVENRLKEETRIDSYSVECKYGDNREIIVIVNVTADGSNENVELVINNGDISGN